MISRSFNVGLNVIVMNLAENLVNVSYFQMRYSVELFSREAILDFRAASIKSYTLS